MCYNDNVINKVTTTKSNERTNQMNKNETTATQEFNSSETSRPQIAATFKRVAWSATDRVLDYGAGKYNLAEEYMTDKVAEFGAVDKFNRTAEHNAEVMERLVNPNIITVNNVLNVIKENTVINEIVEIVASLVADNGKVYFLIHEGNKKGVGTPTGGDKYQRNQPAREYAQFLEKVFGKVTRHGTLYECEK